MPEQAKFEENLVGHLTKTQREARRRVENQLRPANPGNMRAPGWLSMEGKKIFVYTKRRLLKLGLLDTIDRDLLAAYCQAVDQVRTAAGKEQRDWLKVMLACAGELGLGAPARARLAYKKSLYEQQPEDPMDREMEWAKKLMEDGE